MYVPVDFRIHRVINSGSVTRADNISAVNALIIGRGLASLGPNTKRSTPTGNEILLSLLFCNLQGCYLRVCDPRGL